MVVVAAAAWVVLGSIVGQELGRNCGTTKAQNFCRPFSPVFLTVVIIAVACYGVDWSIEISNSSDEALANSAGVLAGCCDVWSKGEERVAAVDRLTVATRPLWSSDGSHIENRRKTASYQLGKVEREPHRHPAIRYPQVPQLHVSCTCIHRASSITSINDQRP